MSQFEWRDFPKLENADDLEKYINDREWSHEGYFHYTKTKNLENILYEKTFWLSPLKNGNDRNDTGAPNRFAFCFSTGKNEVLPMWFLYSGVDGKGVRIKFTKTNVRTLLRDGEYSLVRLDNESQVIKTSCIPLKQGADFTLSFRDVIYGKENKVKGKYDLKYNTMTNYQIPISEYEKYKSHFPGFHKEIVWYYEKETRLMVELNSEFLKEHPLLADENYKVLLSFAHLSNLKYEITFAPYIAEEHLASTLEQNPTIKKHFLKTSSVRCSEYAGMINMRLCDYCSEQNK